MMPPPPPPGPRDPVPPPNHPEKGYGPTTIMVPPPNHPDRGPLPSFKLNNLVGVASDVLIPQEGEIEFYKNDSDMKNGGGSTSSGESANNEDFEEDLSIVSDLGKCHVFYRDISD